MKLPFPGALRHRRELNRICDEARAKCIDRLIADAEHDLAELRAERERCRARGLLGNVKLCEQPANEVEVGKP